MNRVREMLGAMFCVLAIGVLGSAMTCAAADTAAPIPVESFFEHPNYGQAKLSANAKLLATTARVGDRMRLVVIDLESHQPKVVAGFGDVDIAWFAWINDRRLVFSVTDEDAALGNQPGDGLFAVDADGNDLRELMPTIARQARSAAFVATFHMSHFLSRIRGTDDILTIKWESGHKGRHVMRQNTRTARERSVALGIAGAIVGAWADAAGELRAVMSLDKEGHALLNYRPDGDRKWQEVARFDSLYGEDAWFPVGFSPDGETMWVTGRVKRDLAAIYAFDLKRGQLGEMVISHPSADVDGDLRFDPDTGQLLGIAVEADKVQDNWVDADWAKAQATIDAALPGRVNHLTGNVASRLLVRSYSDREPGRYYLYDVQKRSLVEQLAVRPKLLPERLAETRMIRYQARDKLDIPAYLTLPPSSSGTKLPLVVLVHGGPYFVRDNWQFNSEVQFLASRGYAVLQPQFRGSAGFGSHLFRAGWKTWGLAMQDDLSDGVRSLTEKGLIDPARVCIMGASYGGYAALMGVAKDPDLYRCAIDLAGVSDIRLMFSIGYSDFANSLWADFGMKELIGDPDTMEAQFIATAPTEQAGKIKAPVLLAHGSEDYRVPIKHAEKMRDALKAADKPFEWHVYSGEGHGLMKAENRYAYYRAVEAFLARHLGPALATRQAALN
jgi:dipeptidyl aminopeptidase/acylaminoacyl peptidase